MASFEGPYAQLHDRVENDFSFHPGTEVTGPLHDAVRVKCREMAHWLIDNTPAGRDQSLALTALEDVMMRSNKAIALVGHL